MPAGTPTRVALLAFGIVLLAGAAVAAGPAVLDGQPQGSIVAVDNTTAYLQPAAGEAARGGYVHQDVDVSVAVDGDVAALRARHERLTFEEALASDDGRAAQLSTVREHVTDLAERTEAIESAGREARRSYLDGSLSQAAFVRRLARLDGRAAALERLRTTIERRTAAMNPQPRSALTDVQNLEASLETIGGPGMTRVRGRYAGNVSAGATYVSVPGSDGIVVATVVDGTLYRDAHDATERDPDGTDRFSESDEPEISVALRRAATLYPWAFANGNAAQPLRGYGDTAVYRITVQHTQGRLSTYFDGATESVFHEIQQKRVAAVPTAVQHEATDGGLEIRVNATHATGPLEVVVERTGSGVPMDARVSIDGTTVGRTGADGRLWTVQPEGQVTVTARIDPETAVEVTVG